MNVDMTANAIETLNGPENGAARALNSIMSQKVGWTNDLQRQGRAFRYSSSDLDRLSNSWQLISS
jgi:hypothetical protein